MLFIEPRFIVFFAIVLLVHWNLRTNRQRKVWLLMASYFFYGAWDYRFLSLIIASTLIDYAVGLLLSSRDSTQWRKTFLASSLVCNLGLLFFFKYYNFFIESAVSFSATLGLPVSAGTLNIILPVGISFYTFQTLSYSIDVYRRKLEPTRSFLDLALFVGFFPQLVAGPIVRASDFLPQLKNTRNFSDVGIRSCMVLFLVGYFKKACISDNIAPIVDTYFANPAVYDSLSAWIAVLFYAIQIYCDFSGYSDMAIACAGWLGYKLCLNFDFPYFASSITDFWRRWHISLSGWLRDYLYIPLGGNRGSRIFTARNLMLTMILGGLWHGAAWNFVIWGSLHGFALMVHKWWTRRRGDRPQPTGVAQILGPILTFYWVCIAWVFFRSPDLATSLVILKSFILFKTNGTEQVGINMLWLFPCLLAAHWIVYKRYLIERLRWMADWAFAAWYSLATSLVVASIPTGYRAFIYFQF